MSNDMASRAKDQPGGQVDPRAERFLEFRRISTGEAGRQIDVSGKGEREIERIMGGMLINIGSDWRVHDTAWDEPAPGSAAT